MSSSFWPESLVQELADRRGLVFLGAGASMTCKSNSGESFPSWVRLLSEIAKPLTSGDRKAFDDAISSSRLLDAAQIVVDIVDPQSLHKNLLQMLNSSSIRPSKLYEQINLIDQPVVLTTNYDRMYERFWEELSFNAGDENPPLMVSNHLENDVVDHLRAGRRLLIKLHGTIEKPRDIVLSRSQYAKARTENSEFYRVVSALMLTRTMLFVGCGFNGDPDIDLLLEDSAFTAGSIYPHYALLPRGRHKSTINGLRSAYNIQVLEYDAVGGDHSELTDRLIELAELVDSERP
ncbi:SIR2 family NAD-dependent protein deacylase [Rhodococcus erythropolis]